MIYQDELVLREQPIISVFIFTYNQEKLVPITIESVLAQKITYPYELIIAEDCSKDSTLKVCLDYQKKYPGIIRVVGNKPNKGIIKNFHESISFYARGKYVAAVAGDDWWHDTGKLQKQVDFLENNPEYGMVFSDTLVYSEAKKKLLKYKPFNSPCSFKDLIIQNSISALTTCYRKDLFDRYVQEVDPIKEDFPGEDYPFWIWLSYNTKLYHIQLPLTTYRLQISSLSHSESKERRLQFEIDRLNIKLFFYKFFNLDNNDILHDIYLRYYFLTLNTASEANSTAIEAERVLFFKKHKYYFLLLLAKLNQSFASITTLSSLMRFVLDVCMKFRIIDHYYKVYNKPE